MTRASALPHRLRLARWLIAPLAFVGLLLTFTGHAYAGAWGEPVTVSAPGQVAGLKRLASDAAGDQVAVWRQTVGSAEYVVMAAVRPARGTWSAPVKVSTPSASAPVPELAVSPAGRAIIAWTHGSGVGATLEVARGAVNGNWGAPQPVSVAGPEPSKVVVGLDAAGNAVLAWQQGAAGGKSVAAASVEEGGSWGAAQTFPSTFAGFVPPPIVAVNPAGDAVVLSYGGGETMEAMSRPAGSAWRPATDVKTGAVSIFRPSLAISTDDEAVVVWQNGITGQNAQIEAARMSVGGTWSSPASLAPLHQHVYMPSAAIDSGGRATTVWQNDEVGSASGFETATQEPGEAWVGGQTLPVPTPSFEPQVKLRPGGSAMMIWSSEVTYPYELTAAELAADGTWGPELVITEEGEEAFLPVFTTDAAGGVTALWETEGETGGKADNVVRSVAVLPPAPPAPPSDGGSMGGSTNRATTPARPSAAKVCTAGPDAVAAKGYKPPRARAGGTVPGVRARITVPTPSKVSVAATFEYTEHGKSRSVGGGTYSLSVASGRDLQVAVPGPLRDSTPPGSTARVSLRIVAKPKVPGPCPASMKKTVNLRLKVVRLPAGRAR